MKVFRVCMLIIKRRWVTFLIYFAVFMGLSVVMSSLNSDQFNTDFSSLKPNFTVINRDGDSPLVSGLITYLSNNGNEIVIEDDKNALQDATFFRATDYIVIVPHGFRESFLTAPPGGQSVPVMLETVKTTDTAIGFYADSLVNQYLNQARIYIVAGWGPGGEQAGAQSGEQSEEQVGTQIGEQSEEQLVSLVLDDLGRGAIAQKKNFGISVPIDVTWLMFNQVLCYILLVLVILCVTNITMVFRRPDLRMRNLCSPVNSRSQSSQQILAGGVLSLLAWLLLNVIGFVLYGGNLGSVDNRIIGLILLNSLVFSFVAMSLAALSGSFVRSPNAQNAVANILALSLCFLGGVFVPASMLGDGILAVARFLPTYWNVTALEKISALTSFEAGAMSPVWQAILIQVAFAAAFFCATLIIGTFLGKSERSFGSVKTEIE